MAPHCRVELSFDPTYDVEIVRASRGEVTEFRSLGDDPQLAVTAVPGLDAIRPGWWRLRGRLVATDGAIIAPRFYADFGQGYNEADCLNVCQISADGAVDTVVYIKSPLCSLRFDPTVRPTTFELGTLSMEPISRVVAVARMLAGIRAGQFGGPSHARGAAIRLVRDCLRGPPMKAAQALVAEYVRASALPGGSYQLWHHLYDPLRSELAERAARQMAEMRTYPGVALVICVDGARPEQLRRCLASVVAQTWPHWSLSLHIGPASDAVTEVAREFASDPRIVIRRHAGRVRELPVGEAISGVTYAYVGFIEREGELAPQAVCELACVINAHPDAAVVYTDCDRVDRAGHRVEPAFKPDWNPTLLLAQDYVGHLSVFYIDALRSAAEVRVGDPGWHHELMLRCTEWAEPSSVRHIPQVLYHSHAEESSGRPAANMEAVRRHLERTERSTGGLAAVMDQVRVSPAVPEPQPLVTIIIPTRDRLALLRTCVESVLARTEYERYEILVVDNGSVEANTIEYLQALRLRPRCSVLPYPSPFNFSAIINVAARQAEAEVLCLLNNDIEVISAGWLSEMVAHAARPDAGVVGAMLYYPDDTIQHGGVVLGIGGVAGHVHHRSRRGIAGHHGRARAAQEMSAVTGACLVVRRCVFEEVGGFDEGLAVAFNDIDFCLRVLEAGYRNLWTPHAELYHHESASRGHEDTVEKRARFAAEVATMRRRWGTFLDNDPAYNPNLTLDWSNFEPAFPPRAISGMSTAPVRPVRTGS